MKHKTSSRIRDLEVKVEWVHKRLRKVESSLEYLPTVTSFEEWDSITLRDKEILRALFNYGVEGTSTLQLAKDVGIHKPETSGRAIVVKRLRRIQKVSLQLKGYPLVWHVGKNWALNFDDFTFNLK